MDIFPNINCANLVICLSGAGAQNAFTAFITNKIPDVHCIQNGQCFPLYLYEEIPHPNPPHTGEGIGTDGNLNLDLFSSLPSPSRRGAGGEVNSLIRKKLPPQMKEFARLLRKNQTTAESFLWENLRNKQMLGYKFRRQHIIANYIVDFYCHELKLVIELDGGQHAELEHKKADENRDKFLQQHGITVLRYWNNQVLDDNSSALEDIYNYIIDNQEIPHPNPPLIGEGIGTNYFNNLEENARNFSPHLEGEGLGEMSQTHTRKNAITDAGLKHFCDQYARNDFNKEDLFYYIYGLLHSNEYKTKYANNLSKELPRIPAVKSFEDFINFSKAGRKLADLHLNYENVPAHADVIVEYNFNDDVLDNKNYYVTSMKFGKNAQNSKEKDKTTIIYNDFITIKNIPLKAYEYIV
jgi:very-short-patch-repair endonuclease